jgi:hypothetical protein
MNVRQEDDSFLAEENGEVVGSARLRPEGGVILELGTPHEAVAVALLRAVAAERAYAAEPQERRPSHGSVHLQTDDQTTVVQAVSRLVPRVFRSRTTVVAPPRNGWVAVYDEVAEREPRQLGRLGRELSNATGLVVFAIGIEEGTAVHYIAFERGRTLDEYLSLPHFRGQLPSGDAVALRANPTVLARLTGASPAAVRAVARSADFPSNLPPAEELLRELAEVLGLEGTRIKFEDAHYIPDAVVVEHE